jgi:hypothetical protein
VDDDIGTDEDTLADADLVPQNETHCRVRRPAHDVAAVRDLDRAWGTSMAAFCEVGPSCDL